jgi:hypothetical protein
MLKSLLGNPMVPFTVTTDRLDSMGKACSKKIEECICVPWITSEDEQVHFTIVFRHDP